jgi:outer membrane protein assembly factor BamB
VPPGRRGVGAGARALAPGLLLVAAACGHAAAHARHHSSSASSTSAAAAPTPRPAPSAGGAWTTYGGSTARTSADTAEGPLLSAPVRAWTSPPLDGAVYGEPIVFGGQVLVATEADTVYGLSADNGTVEWSVHLGSPVPAGSLPCGDISPTVGVTSTMTVDPSSGVLFVSAALWNGTSVAHDLFALDLSSHAVRWRRRLDQPGWSAAAQLQRAALALDDGNVLVALGGNYGDCGSYHGWVIGVPESGVGPLLHYEVPTADQGGIWAPPGPATDAAGDVFVSTGNGSARPGQAFDHGDAVIELSPSLRELQYWAPANWAQLNAQDLDLGSTTPVVIGDGRLFVVGKGGTGYLLDASSLGGVGAAAPSVALCNSRGASAYAAGTLYVVCPDAGTVDQVLVGSDTLRRGWTWVAPDGGASSPTLARGELWVVDRADSTLYGVDLGTGTTRWALPLRTGTPPPFAGVSAAEGLLVVGGSAAVEAFR